MLVILGCVFVAGCVLGGFLMAGGHLGALIHPSEIVTIGGAALAAAEQDAARADLAAEHRAQARLHLTVVEAEQPAADIAAVELIAVAQDDVERARDRVAGAAGRGGTDDLDLLDQVAGNIQGRTICALGDAAAMPVRAFLKHYRDEFMYHIEHKKCLVPDYI